MFRLADRITVLMPFRVLLWFSAVSFLSLTDSHDIEKAVV